MNEQKQFVKSEVKSEVEENLLYRALDESNSFNVLICIFMLLKRKEKQLLPTIVVSHPCTQKTYVFVPKSGSSISQVKCEAPWFWTKSPWQSLLDSPMQFCKMAFHALARCWKNKPNQIYQVY